MFLVWAFFRRGFMSEGGPYLTSTINQYNNNLTNGGLEQGQAKPGGVDVGSCGKMGKNCEKRKLWVSGLRIILTHAG
jgi:hypothetical protein